MIVLLDTNLALRLVDPGHPHAATATQAVKILLRQGHDVRLVPQVCYEFWVVATRPSNAGGIGWSTGKARGELDRLRALFALTPDVPTVFPAWQRLVVQHDTKGKVAHDARLVAAMLVHGIDAILTFNARDFTRYTTIAVLDPAAVAAVVP